MEPMTQEDWLSLPCDECGKLGCAEEGLLIKARCHQDDPPTAEYKAGVITFTCSVCDEFITHVAVAKQADTIVWN